MEQVVTIRVPVKLVKRLDVAAKRMQRSRSYVMRLALERYLESQKNIKPYDLVRDLIGTVDTGISDLGQNHEKYLREKFRRGR